MMCMCQKIHFNVILPYGPRFSKWSVSLRVFHQITFAPLLSPIHLILLDFITQIIFGEEYRSLSSSLCSFLHSPITSTLSNTLSLNSSLNVSDQVSHPHKTTGKIVVLYILVFIFLDSNLEDFALNVSKHFLTSICS